jgi:effector-binding domain-containing protein
MSRHSNARTGMALLAGLLLLASPWTCGPARAQQAAGPTPAETGAPAPSPTAAGASPGASAAAPAPSPAPSPASPTPGPAPTPALSPLASPAPSATPASPDTNQAGEGATMGETLDLVSRPAAYLEAKADRDEVFGAVTGSIDAIRAELAEAGIKPAGRPVAIFLEADDVGFKYRAAIPIDSIPDGKTALSGAVKLGQTPIGKAMRFEHRGAYEDIDATYEAITAYLDEKGIDAQDVFIEEYLNDIKAPDDPNLQVDIFVLLK